MDSLMKAWELPMPKPDNFVQNQPTCEDEHTSHARHDEHISHARHILSFYKFHVQGIDNLINHYDQERDARRKAEKKQKDALEKIEVELNETREQLATTRCELDASTAALSKTKEASNATEKKLDATKKELATTKTQLQTTQTDLSKTKDQLHTSEGKLQRTTAELTTTNERLKGTTGKLNDLTTEHEKLRSAVQGLNKIISQKEKDLKAANDSEKAKEEEKDAAFVARDKAMADYANSLANPGNAFKTHEERTLGDYYIEHAVYGNTIIVDPGVIRKLLNKAVEHKSFDVTDKFFGAGSLTSGKDLFTVIYAVKGKGPFKIKSVKEGEKMKFD